MILDMPAQVIDSIDYLLVEPKAKEIILWMAENSLVGSWSAQTKIGTNPSSFVRWISIGQPGKEAKIIYSGREAGQYYEVIRELAVRGILEANNSGAGGAPVKYALKGEWVRENLPEGFKAARFNPDLQTRIYLQERIIS
jgi:hypothetical protein